MPIDFRQLLRDPRLLKLFQLQAGLDDEELEEMLAENAPSMFWQWLKLEETLGVHHAEGAGVTRFGVYGWGGLFFPMTTAVPARSKDLSTHQKPQPYG